MTTWHDDESLVETLEFAKNYSAGATVKLDDILVLDFRNEDRKAEIEELYQSA